MRGEGLDRIFRIILQSDAQLPEQLIARIRLNPSFEYVRAIEMSEAPQPARSTSVTEIQFDKSRERIGLRSAHLFGQGDPRVKWRSSIPGLSLSIQRCLTPSNELSRGVTVAALPAAMTDRRRNTIQGRWLA